MKHFIWYKLILWLVLSLAVSVLFFPEFWSSLRKMLTISWIFSQHHAAPWGMLGLCVLWLWLLRKRIRRDMLTPVQPVFIPIGLALVFAALFIPDSEAYLVFRVLLAVLGVYTMFFGRAVRLPAVLLTIYGFVVWFPLVIEKYAELPYSVTAIKPLVWLLSLFGYAFTAQEQWLRFTSFSGEPISVTVTAACAGPTTMAVFIAIFALMMLDMPVTPRKAGWLLLFGVTGTWLQSVIRLVILMTVGFQWGREALFTAHFWTIYILFPLWYLGFVYVYFRQIKQVPKKDEKPALHGANITEN